MKDNSKRKTPASKKSTKRPALSAEDMSVRSGRPKGDFPTQLQLTLGNEDKVFTADEVKELRSRGDVYPSIFDIENGTPAELVSSSAPTEEEVTSPKVEDSSKNKASKPLSKVKPTSTTQKPSKKKTAVSKESAIRIEKAIREIGGSLSVLNEHERAAVLSRITGAFHYGTSPKSTVLTSVKASPVPSKKGKETLTARVSVKDRSKTSPKSEKKSPPKGVKSDFNNKFAKTYEGQLFAVTSKILKNCGKSGIRFSQYGHAMHKALLNAKGRFKAMPSKMVAVEVSDANQMIQRIIDGVDTLLQEEKSVPEQDELIHLMESALCLIQGKDHTEKARVERCIPDAVQGVAHNLTVQRTVQEEEARIASLARARTAKRNRRKETKRTSSNSPSPKRRKGDSTNAEADSQESSASEEETMELDG